MIENEFSIEDQRWPITPALVWIASRSFKFVKALANLPPSASDPALWALRKECSSPLNLGLQDAFRSLRQKINDLGGTDWSMFKQENGSFRGFNEHELWLMAVEIAKTDLLRHWPPFLDCEAIKATPWQPPAGLSADWVRNLPAGEHVSLSDVIDFLAFGKSRAPIGLSDSEVLTARLRVGLAIDAARNRGTLEMFGTPAQRWPEQPHLVRSLGPLGKIKPNAEEPLSPVPYGARDWVGPLRYVEEFAEIGAAPESVSFINVTVNRGSLRRWLEELSGKGSGTKRGARPKYPWAEMEREMTRLMDVNGEFMDDDPDWKWQAQLEKALLEFCSKKFDCEPSISQLRTRLVPWLRRWRENRKVGR